ncbi:hypothetical protein StoSoilB5_20770 [Arthrobacter sp. StoSoilB5]|nr:hypothetical protein StoSoilB5_20770 [Arthrobacter sp. StoSoilB5]
MKASWINPPASNPLKDIRKSHANGTPNTTPINSKPGASFMVDNKNGGSFFAVGSAAVAAGL